MMVRLDLARMQHVKKNRDPRWDEEFQFMLEEPPVNDRIHVEVLSASSRIGLLHPKVYTHTHARTHTRARFFSIIDYILKFESCYDQESLGYVDINLSDVVSNKRINSKYHLIDSKNGRVQIELQWRTSS